MIIFLGISPFVFSNAIQNSNDKNLKSSNASSSAPSELHEMPLITNEAEYAEFQKQKELAVSASSSLSAQSNSSLSHSNKSKAASK